jgi:GTP-binding protein
VLIGEEDNSVVFDWDPGVPAEGVALGPRGSDARLG